MCLFVLIPLLLELIFKKFCQMLYSFIWTFLQTFSSNYACSDRPFTPDLVPTPWGWDAADASQVPREKVSTKFGSRPRNTTTSWIHNALTSWKNTPQKDDNS